MAGVEELAGESRDGRGSVSPTAPLGWRVDRADADAVRGPSGERGERDGSTVVPEEQSALIVVPERDVTWVARLVGRSLVDERVDPLDDDGEIRGLRASQRARGGGRTVVERPDDVQALLPAPSDGVACEHRPRARDRAGGGLGPAQPRQL